LSPLLQFSEAKELHIQPAEFNSTEWNIQHI
jgi:hypothetical protein